MSTVLCPKCESFDGLLCAVCGKANHFVRKEGGWTSNKYNACWRKLRYSKKRFKQCEGHVAPFSECDNCHARAPMRKVWGYYYPQNAEGYKEVRGLTGDKTMLFCPTCFGTARVGLDWALEHGGESIIVSVACAFAFQLGQYADDLPSTWRSLLAITDVTR